MRERLFLTGVLLVMGAGWGICIPLAKVATSGGYQPYGLVFWETVIVSLFLGALCAIRRRLPRVDAASLRVYLVVAFFGAIGPGGAYYAAAGHLPAGVLAILMSCSPLFSFPLALLLGNDRFRAVRLGGLSLGLFAIVLLIGPDASLPDPAMALFIPVALIAPLCYATENNVLARWGTAGMDPIQVVAGASVLATLVMAPLALITGQWIAPLPPYGLPDFALVASALIHAVVYAAYVWLVGRAGSVFTSQAAYLITGFGVAWSILLLGEVYSGYVWATLALMLAGVFLVQPQRRIALAPVVALADDAPGGNPRGQG